ncbi:RHS repeat domain-containing protein [Methylocystis sp. JAN1]|uniref:RHS repeat domain-containing protein n=1 Tax=Methylocystis sp. JAN1 TaxID=3397211 RepID=UPI003FA3159F
MTSAYAYPATSNRLSAVTPSGGTARSFAYDASGDIVTDSRSGALGMSFEYDAEGRLSRAWQTNAPSQGATYGYDAMNRLVSRRATNGSTTTTMLYVHDINDHIIAEMDAAGVTKREYVWLDDLPIAVVDGADTASPALYFVHTDHLKRPARMVNINWSWVWDVIYSPFGSVSYLWDATAKLDMRFPGQWFQMESGLAYNWHRHYDATIGRYVQPDPLRVDEREGEAVGGLVTPAPQLRRSPPMAGDALGANFAPLPPDLIRRANFVDGPALFSYARLNPMVIVDPAGLGGLKGFEEMKVQQFCGQFCQGKVLSEIPSQFLECSVGDVIAAAKSGDATARKAYKLLNDNRFRK